MIEGMYTRNKTCRMCKSSDLLPFLDLSPQPPANAFLRPEQFSRERAYPLVAYFCRNCNLAQLLDVVDKRELFSDYVYFTSVMPTTPKHFTDYAKSAAKRFHLKNGKSFVVEIGSNDGLLLRAFQEEGTRVLGIDPAENIAKIANENGIPTIADFWSEALAKKIARENGKAKAIIGNNVVAHINDSIGLVKGVRALLDENGVFIFEAPYLGDMFENLAFDTIYHEHLSFLSLRPLLRLFKKYGMEIFDVEFVRVQGNSFRVFACRKGAYPKSPNVEEAVKKEIGMDLDKFSSYKKLARRVEESKKKLLHILLDLKSKGKSIAGYGAPAKGNTLLNFCKIGPETLDYLTEELPTKIGLSSPGMHIPVIHIKSARKSPPEYFLMLAWNYQDKILEKEKLLRKRGVKFIIPTEGIKIL
ncbi:class I SAM-dependent methyltransferase [bacterium]|nr:class I SAM-dependent methyltransferase [bacterium]